MENPVTLTTSGQSVCINNIYLDIKDLTPAIDGQLIPASPPSAPPCYHTLAPMTNISSL